MGDLETTYVTRVLSRKQPSPLFFFRLTETIKTLFALWQDVSTAQTVIYESIVKSLSFNIEIYPILSKSLGHWWLLFATSHRKQVAFMRTIHILKIIFLFHLCKWLPDDWCKCQIDAQKLWYYMFIFFVASPITFWSRANKNLLRRKKISTNQKMWQKITVKTKRKEIHKLSSDYCQFFRNIFTVFIFYMNFHHIFIFF